MNDGITEALTDSYATRIVVQRKPGWENVGLTFAPANGGEPYSYGFTLADFQHFADAVRRVSLALGTGT